jgi:alpha-ribazole phosphatase
VPARIYLIRHAESTSNAEQRYAGSSDSPLSEWGRRQAEQLAEALHAVPLRAVYTSPLRRAVETASPIATDHGLEPVLVPDFREHGLGDWEGLTLSDVETRYPELLKQWYDRPNETRIPGGETIDEMRARVVPVFREIAGRHSDEPLAIIAHGGVNRAILLSVLDAPLSSYWRFRLPNAGISLVEMDGDRAWLMVMNDTAHLR